VHIATPDADSFRRSEGYGLHHRTDCARGNAWTAELLK
jgi:hypothetical protein